METKTLKRWYEGKTGNHQGLVIEEETGKSIAVTYDKKDAPLIAAAPELLEAASYALEYLEANPDEYSNPRARKIRAILSQVGVY